MTDTPALHVVMSHYVREFRRTAFPEIKGMELDAFRNQVQQLRHRFEMATVESSLAFLSGAYQPRRELCLLTFDDGLKEHFDTVTPILADQTIQGVFFLVTSCLEDSRVAPVHMNHFLMAHLGMDRYCNLFAERLRQLAPESLPALENGHELESVTYPWDTAKVARFKYFFNFVMDAPMRDQLVAGLFTETFGSEDCFARELYVSWEDARDMQQAGMAIGGHTHTHRPLAALPEAELEEDLAQCRALLRTRLESQSSWPFSYPYGKKTSFNQTAAESLKKLRFDCAFSTETGPNLPGSDLFQLRRMDCKNAPA
jgi:peptidoglycan/xylan/chitin deacetylase (PgdA/CDA1 family)